MMQMESGVASQKSGVMGRDPLTLGNPVGVPLLYVLPNSAPEDSNRADCIHSCTKGLCLRVDATAEPCIGLGLGFLLVRPVWG